MSPSASRMLGLACAILASGCASRALAPDDRREACTIAVEAPAAAPAFRANVLSGGAGPLAGAGMGVAVSGQAGAAAIFMAPLGLIVGAGVGTACAAAAAQHPQAERDFQVLLAQADARALVQGIEAGLAVARPECEASPARTSGTARVEIEKIDIRMGCLFGKQNYWTLVPWRVVGATGRELAADTRRCEQKSFREVEDWFREPDAARAELERLLRRTGERIAADILGDGTQRPCVLEVREADLGAR